MSAGVQTALLCGCGSALILRAGRWPRCLRRDRLSRENFDGLRELVLERDGYQCRCCGEVEYSRLVVHHRRPGWNRPAWLITICRACHVRVHLMFRPRYSCSGLPYTLWREVHRGRPLQTRLALEGEFSPAEQGWLFPEIDGQVNGGLELGNALPEGGDFGRVALN